MTKQTIEKLKKITRENSSSVQYVNAQIKLFKHYYYSLIALSKNSEVKISSFN